MRASLALLLLAGTCGAATYHVAETNEARDSNPGTFRSPLRTIQAAVDKAAPGDTILIHTGTYRESVQIRNGGTPTKPTALTAAPHEQVVITGADLIPSVEWTQVAGKPVWRHTPWTYRGPTHPNDERHRLIGRTEQVIVDGKLLAQVLEPDQLRAGSFCADVPGKALYVWLPDESAPAGHRIEASVRPVLMNITASHVAVSDLRFVYGSNRAQQAVLEIGGSDNLVEDCIVEWTNGVGARLGGERNVARRLVSRSNGQLGMSGHGVANRMEHCTLEGNNVKGYSKSWEAGGIKIAVTRNFRVRRCIAVGNDGPGIWFDIDNRDGLVERSYAAENNGPGIFVEISETTTVRNNLCVRNGLKDERGAWGHAGILLGEAMRCIVEHNVCVENRIGIEVRQQRVRSLPADQNRDRPEEKRYYSDGLVFSKNISAFNREWQFALFGDNAFFGAKKEAPPRELELLDPDRRGWRSQSNVYYAGAGEGLLLWGAKWLPKHQEYSDLKVFEAQHHLEQGTLVADPLFVNRDAGDFQLKAGSPAKRVGAGFTEAPVRNH